MKFIAFDLETTGFIPGVDRIVEIGAVRFVDEQVEAVFSTLVDPQISIPKAATEVNGITDDMVADKPTIDRLLDPFAEFGADSVIVAHNAGFDVPFLTSEIEKFETSAPKGLVLDTLSLARKVYPGLPNYKLGTLVHHLGIPTTNFHRAEEDASYCGKLFFQMMTKMTGTNQMPPLDNLIQLTGKPEMRFPQISKQPKQLDMFDLI
ncbi:MAG: 3'-5' exonuclease [Bdellovibrionales bacterium]